MPDIAEYWSKEQTLAWIVISTISSSFSILGALVVISQILRNESNKKSMQQRIGLAMSILDIFCSFSMVFQVLLMSNTSDTTAKDNYQRSPDFNYLGNDNTCMVSFFFLVLWNCPMLYNAMLSINYVLMVRYGWSNTSMLRIEPIFHFIPLVFGAGVAVYTTIMKIRRSEEGKFCFYYANDYGIFYIVNILAIAMVTINQIVLYVTVKTIEQNGKKYRATSSSSKCNSYTRATLIQSLYYVGAFYITYGWTFLVGFTSYRYTWLITARSIFFPLQGF